MRTLAATDSPAPDRLHPCGLDLSERRLRLTDLAAALEDIELRTHPARAGGGGGVGGGMGAVPTGWPAIDLALGAPRGSSTSGLARGHIHDWVGLCPSSPDAGAAMGRSDLWLPPLSILIHLARQVIAHAPTRALVVWIGPRCRPYPCAMPGGTHEAGGEILARSIFVDACSPQERAWAIDVSLRSPGVSAVIADASGLNLNCSRRFQLAAGAGHMPLGLLVHPPWQIRELSAAQTRWRVAPAPPKKSVPEGPTCPATHPDPGWTVELLRRKGPRPESEGARIWTVRRDHETGDLHLAPDASDRRVQTPAGPAIAHRRLSA